MTRLRWRDGPRKEVRCRSRPLRQDSSTPYYREIATREFWRKQRAAHEACSRAALSFYPIFSTCRRADAGRVFA